MDFSKINLNKNAADGASTPKAPRDTKDSESQVNTPKLPTTGLNFKKINLGNKPGVNTAPAAPARTTPAPSAPADKQASGREPHTSSDRKPSTSVAGIPRTSIKPVANATNALPTKSPTATNVSTNATNANGASKSDSTNAKKNPANANGNSTNVGNGSTNATKNSFGSTTRESKSFFNGNSFGGDSNSSENPADNPFLDDDDEYTLNVDEISERGARETSYDPDGDDAEPFLGFDDAFVKSSSKSTNATSTTNANNTVDGDSVASTRDAGVSSVDDGFDDLLDDLLEDDEYSVSPSTNSTSSNTTNASNASRVSRDEDFSSMIDANSSRGSASVRDSVRGSSVKPVSFEESTNTNGAVASGSGVSGVSGSSESVARSGRGDVSSARDEVKKNSVRGVELDSRTQEDLEVRRKNVKDSRARRDAERGPAKVKELKRTRLESEFVKQAPSEVLVDGKGRPLSKLSDAESEESTNATNASGSLNKSSESVVEKQRYRYMRPDGRLNGAELEFFKNAQVSKKAALSVPSEMERLRGPVGRNESEAERRERQKHIVRAAAGRSGMQRGKQPRFGQKEREVLEFLAMFRYATDRQLARMFSESQGTAYNRLKRLRQQGLVIDKKIYGNRPIWFLTDAGLIISGYDLPRVTESKLTFSMFPHQFTVNNTAANLWGANVNVLHQSDYPSKYRTNFKNENVYGESLVSELEIQSSFGKVKGFDKADVYRPQLLGNIEREFRDWKRAGGVEFGPSPEMIYGNEYMWSLMPPFNIHLAYHVPDLVLKRERNADGTPNSIAVEIEISNKPSDSYEKTLRAYKSDNRLYKKVIWVCKNAGPARKLETIAKEIGLWQDGRIDIVPVITEDGVFKERDLWTI